MHLGKLFKDFHPEKVKLNLKAVQVEVSTHRAVADVGQLAPQGRPLVSEAVQMELRRVSRGWPGNIPRAGAGIVSPARQGVSREAWLTLFFYGPALPRCIASGPFLPRSLGGWRPRV